MALLWCDGFDHYGLDETRLTDGPYSEVGPAFSLSESNPRTGSRHIRHSTSTDQGLLQRNLGSPKTVVGTGLAVYLDQLPNIDDAYVLCDFRDQNGGIQVSAVVQSDGKIVIKRGDKSGFVIGQSDTNVIQAGEQQHIEIAINFDSGETESNVLVDVNHVWDFQVTSGWPTAPDPEAVTIPDSGYSQGEAPFGFKGSSSTFDQPFPHVTNWDRDTFIWLRTTLITDGNSDIFISSQIENGALFYFDGEFIVADNPTNAARNANFVGAGNVEFTIDKSIATAGVHTLHVLAMDGPDVDPEPNSTENTYFFATYERVNVQNVTGQLEVRVNGVTEISEVGVDTTRTEKQECSFVSLFCGGGPGAHGVTTDVDDWYIWDDLGAWNNSFLGDRRCYLLKPNQDTNISDFDPSSGSFSYKMIDDDSPDDDSTYIIAEAYLQSGSPLTGTSEFEIEDLPNGASLISAVNVVTRASKTDSTSAEIFTSINSGSDSLSSDAHILTTSYQYFNDIYEYDPETIANLTKDRFNALSVSVTADDLDPGVTLDSPEDFDSPTGFDPSELFAMGEFGGWYDPSDLSTIWQDAAGTVPVTTDGQSVARIDDKSGNGLHLTQPTASMRPIYKTDGTLHWLEFDGADDFLFSGTLAQDIMDGNGFMSISFSVDVTSYVGAIFSEELLTDAGPRVTLFGDTRASPKRFANYRASGADLFIDLISQLDTNAHVSTLNNNGTTATGKLDGVTQGSVSGSTNFSSATRLELGSQLAAGPTHDGKIFGALIVDSFLSLEDETSMINFLSEKAGA